MCRPGEVLGIEILARTEICIIHPHSEILNIVTMDCQQREDCVVRERVDMPRLRRIMMSLAVAV